MLVPFIAADKLYTFFSRIEGPMLVPPVDAYVTTDDGNSSYIKAGTQGSGLDHEATAAAMTSAALNAGNRTAAAVSRIVEPAVTTEDVKAMGLTTRLGIRTEVYDKGKDEREWNVRLATAKVSSQSVQIVGGQIITQGNIILAPGEEFDFLERLGPRTDGSGLQRGLRDRRR